MNNTVSDDDKVSIVIVEDESVVAIMLSKNLERLGYHIAGNFDNGERLLDELGNGLATNVILMDINLNGRQDGIETASQVKARFNIPVIYVTAYSDQSIFLRAQQTAPYGYIIKPFQTRELNIAIQMAISKHTMEKRLFQSEAATRKANEDLLEANNKLRNTLLSIQRIEEELRKRMSRDVHDILGQELVAAKIKLGWLRKFGPGNPDESQKTVLELEEALNRMVDTVHNIAHELRPMILDKNGLIPAILHESEVIDSQTELQVTAEFDSDSYKASSEVEIAIFRIVQQSLNNILRHADASEIDISVNRLAEIVEFRISDNGLGFDPEQLPSNRHGLESMKERAFAISGQLNISSTPGEGTDVVLGVPVQAFDRIN